MSTIHLAYELDQQVWWRDAPYKAMEPWRIYELTYHESETSCERHYGLMPSHWPQRKLEWVQEEALILADSDNEPPMARLYPQEDDQHG